jgi:hypothetical protein
VHALHIASLGSAGVAFIGGVVSLIWLPGRGAPETLRLPAAVPNEFDAEKVAV